MTLTHRCPGPGTVHSQGGVIPVDRLACSRHWFDDDGREVELTWAMGRYAGQVLTLRRIPQAGRIGQ